MGANAIRPYTDAAKPTGFHAKKKSEAPNDPRIGPKTDLKPAARVISRQKQDLGLGRPSFHLSTPKQINKPTTKQTNKPTTNKQTTKSRMWPPSEAFPG